MKSMKDSVTPHKGSRLHSVGTPQLDSQYKLHQQGLYLPHIPNTKMLSISHIIKDNAYILPLHNIRIMHRVNNSHLSVLSRQNIPSTQTKKHKYDNFPMCMTDIHYFRKTLPPNTYILHPIKP